MFLILMTLFSQSSHMHMTEEINLCVQYIVLLLALKAHNHDRNTLP